MSEQQMLLPNHRECLTLVTSRLEVASLAALHDVTFHHTASFGFYISMRVCMRMRVLVHACNQNTFNEIRMQTLQKSVKSDIPNSSAMPA